MVGPRIGSLPSPKIEKKILASSDDEISDLHELREMMNIYEKRLNEARIKQSQSVPQAEMNSLLDQFESLVSELETAKSESARYKFEAEKLSLALSSARAGVEGVSLDSPNAMRLELERLRTIELEYQALKTEHEILDKKYCEKVFQKDELLNARLEVDKLTHEKSMVEKRLVVMSTENERLKEQLDKVSLEVIDARKNLNVERDKYAAKVGELTISQGTLQTTVADMQMTESRWKNKISEMETMLEESRKREEKSQNEAHALRGTISGFDEEIRNLATSLAAESEANETLQIRLERVENELNKSQLDISNFQKRDRNMSLELNNMSVTAADNSELRAEINRLTFELGDRDKKISEISNSRDLLKRSLGGEIQRLHAQLDYTNSRSSALVEKYDKLVREKDKMKSLLANDTITRLNRSLLHN